MSSTQIVVARSSMGESSSPLPQTSGITRGGLHIDPRAQSSGKEAATRPPTKAGSLSKALCDSADFPIVRPISRKVGPKRLPQNSFHGWTFAKRLARPTSLILQRVAGASAAVFIPYYFMKSELPTGPHVTTSVAVTKGPDDQVISTTQTTTTAPQPHVPFSKQDFVLLGGLSALTLIAFNGAEMKAINDVFWDHWGLTLAQAQRMSYREIDRYLETEPPLMPQQARALEQANARLKELNKTARDSERLGAVLQDETAVQIKLTEAIAYDVITNIPTQRMEVTLFRTRAGQLEAKRLIEGELADASPEHFFTARAMFFLKGLSSGRDYPCINALAAGEKGTGKSHLAEIDKRLFGIPQADIKMAPPVWGGASVLLPTLADPYVQSKFPMNRLVLLGQILFHLYTHRVTNLTFKWNEFNFADQTAVDILKVQMDPKEMLSIDGVDLSWVKRNLFNLVMTNARKIEPAILDRCPFLFLMTATTGELKARMAEDNWERTIDLFKPASPQDSGMSAESDGAEVRHSLQAFFERIFKMMGSKAPAGQERPRDEEQGPIPVLDPVRDICLTPDGEAALEKAKPVILDYLLTKHLGQSARMSVAIAVAVHLGIEALDPLNSHELRDTDPDGKLMLTNAKQIIDQHYFAVSVLSGLVDLPAAEPVDAS